MLLHIEIYASQW